MLRDNPEYRRLKVGGRGALGSASYWLGRDHLFVVVQGGYVESYRRFLFSDIQALVVRKTRSRWIVNAVGGFLAVPCLLSGLASLPGSPVGGGILLGLAVVSLVVVAVNSLRGPTCVCHLWTAVQQSPLPNVTRWRHAQRLLAELSPHLLQTQSTTEPAPSASQQPAEAVGTAAPEPVAGSVTVGEDPNAPPRIVS